MDIFDDIVVAIMVENVTVGFFLPTIIIVFVI